VKEIRFGVSEPQAGGLEKIFGVLRLLAAADILQRAAGLFDVF